MNKYIIIGKHRDSDELHIIGQTMEKLEADATFKFLRGGSHAWFYWLTALPDFDADKRGGDSSMLERAIMNPSTSPTPPPPGVDKPNPPPLPGVGSQPTQPGVEEFWKDPVRLKAWLAKRQDIENSLAYWEKAQILARNDREAILKFMRGEV